MNVWLFIAGLFAATTAMAFPDAIRRGYPNCGTCHYSPLGSGPLTPYGKGTAVEIFPTFQTPQIPSSETVIYGADMRRLYMSGSVPIQMQTEAHLGATYSGATIVAGIDSEGPRYAWASLQLGPIRARAGRFKPMYAIPYDDHTVPLLGNSKNSITNNIELSYAGRYGEIVGTRILGDSRFNDNGLLLVGRDDAALTANVYLGKKCKFGGTLVSDKRAVHMQCAATSSLYTSAEWSTDRFILVGWEILQGLHARLSLLGDDHWRYSVRWLPINGIEAILEADRDRIFVVSHLWL